jgi:hypothetical protein
MDEKIECTGERRLLREHFEMRDNLEHLTVNMQELTLNVKTVAGVAEKTDAELRAWVRAGKVAVTLVMSVIGIFFWVLIEKNNQLIKMTEITTTNQQAIQMIVQTQTAVRDELRRQSDNDAVTMRTMLEALKIFNKQHDKK